jgi:hypothetical protein
VDEGSTLDSVPTNLDLRNDKAPTLKEYRDYRHIQKPTAQPEKGRQRAGVGALLRRTDVALALDRVRFLLQTTF